MLIKKNKELLLIFILLFFSGNPLAALLFGKWSNAFGLFITGGLIGFNQVLKKKFLKSYILIAGVVLVIITAQFATLSFVSWVGAINLLIKILFGGIVVYHFKERFNNMFFEVMYKLSVVSLIMFLIVNIAHVSIPSIDLGNEKQSFFLHGTIAGEYWYKNIGMFWEPGAYAGILTTCLALNFNKLQWLWINERRKLLVVIVTLLTTQSTTGYLVGFLIASFYFLNAKNKVVAFVLLPIFLILGWGIYENTEFLKDKIEGQYEKSQEQSVGELSNTRFGSLVFDWHYIQKHPIIGNGLHEKTRFADHQYLFVGADGDVIGSGNGFSNYLASMGIIFVLGYFFLVRKATLAGGNRYSLLVFLVILLNLQGEQWFNFPLYLGLVFLVVAPIEKLIKRPRLKMIPV